MQQIYKAYGYELPRVAQDQSQYGTQIPVEDAQPGDLIFLRKAGHVYHVVMYAGVEKRLRQPTRKPELSVALSIRKMQCGQLVYWRIMR